MPSIDGGGINKQRDTDTERAAGIEQIEHPLNNSIQYISHQELSLFRFQDDFMNKQKPVIITNALSHWKAMRKWPIHLSKSNNDTDKNGRIGRIGKSDKSDKSQSSDEKPKINNS